MARAYGSNACLLLKREESYGTQGSGSFIRMPFNSCALGSEQGLLDDPVLGHGRDPRAPLYDVIHDEGDIAVPLDPRFIGLWLTGLLGDPTTTEQDDDSYEHVFHSGSQNLPSYSLEIGMPEVPAWFMHTGVKINSWALEFSRSGAAAATINAIAQGETRKNTSQAGEPQVLAFTRISQFQGGIRQGETPLANLTGGSLTYANNLEKIETIRSDGKIEGADPTMAALTGNLEVRFADTTLIDAAASGTPVDLEFSYRMNEKCFIAFKAHELYLPKAKLAVEGPGGIQARFEFQGSRPDHKPCMLTVTLRNDIEGAVYQ